MVEDNNVQALSVGDSGISVKYLESQRHVHAPSDAIEDAAQ